MWHCALNNQQHQQQQQQQEDQQQKEHQKETHQGLQLHADPTKQACGDQDDRDAGNKQSAGFQASKLRFSTALGFSFLYAYIFNNYRGSTYRMSLERDRKKQTHTENDIKLQFM